MAGSQVLPAIWSICTARRDLHEVIASFYISILFLFTLMLMHFSIRVVELISYTSNSLPLALFFSLTIFYVLSFSFGNLGELDLDMSSSYRWDGALVNGSEISSIGNVMYASHALWLVVTGFILLLAMVGTIAISLKPKSNEGIVLNDKNLYKSSSSPRGKKY